MTKLPTIGRDEISPDKQAVYDQIISTRGSMLNVFGVLFNNPNAAEAVSRLGEYLRYRSVLDPTVREILILSTAKELNVEYEWAHHEIEARKVGLSDVTIEAIRSGRAPMGIPPKEGVFAQAARELVRDSRMTDRTYQAVEHLLSPMQLIDLILVVGYYSMLAKVLKTLDVELDEGIERISLD